MATLNDIAEKLGITKGTVSKALNDAPDISETMRKTVLETAVEMGYTLKRQKKDGAKKLCIFIENMDYQAANDFGYEIVLGFKKAAEPAGYQVDLVSVTPEFQKTHPYDIHMLQNGYVGSFVLGFALADPWMAQFTHTRYPTVLYDNYVKGNLCTAYVGLDNYEGLDLLISHLKGLGHQRIGLLSGALGSHITQARYKAFHNAMRKNHLKIDSDLVRCSYYITECTSQHLPHLLNHGATAIVCSHDMLANAVLTACRDFGYRIPEDLSIVGFDDLPLSAYTFPPLTTIRQDREALGKCGYFALNSLLEQVSVGTLLLHAQLILRSSTGKVPSQPAQPASPLPMP